MTRRIRCALQAYWEQADAVGLPVRLLCWLLVPASWVYGVVQRTRRSLYRRGVLRSRKLFPWVVSIGGLRVGGSGKTPFTLWLARRFRERGCRVAVLTRGYGRRDARESMILCGPDTRGWDPDRCGDEPFLLARSLEDVPVVVDADRYRGALNAMRFFPVDVFLLDDGFQHLALARDCDIVLLPDGEDPSRIHMLPRGPARETASSLRDADIVVRVGSVRASEGASRTANPSRCAGGALGVCDVRMVPGPLRVLGRRATVDPAALQGERLFAFCGIGRPRAFRAALEEAGLKVDVHVAYPDHHRYTARDHRTLLERLADFDRAVTTEKDAVKLARFPWPEGKLLVLGISAVLDQEAAFWEALDAKLAGGTGRACNGNHDRGRSTRRGEARET